MRGHPAALFFLINLFLIFSSFKDSSANGNVDVNDALFTGGLEFNDLSHPYDNKTVYWPGGKRFAFTKKFAGKRTDGVWYSTNEFCTAEHGGTHLDAPFHFNPDGWTVGQIPFENLITPLVIVDLSKLVRGDEEFLLQRSHMDNLFHLDTRRNYTVIFRFGWSQYYGNITKYLGAVNPNQFNLKFPGISADVANWLVESKNLVGVGVDTPSVDAGQELKGVVHTILAGHNIFMLENLKIEKELPSSLCSVIVMPMKIQDGTGAPCRVTAICPKLLGQTLF
nr:kynurenine formamidase [Limnephilus flavicornis]